MKTTQHLSKRIISVLLTIAMTLSLAGCGGAQGSTTYAFEVVSGIDMNSITVEDDVTTFTSVNQDGVAIRFQGTGITVEEGRILLHPDGKLVCLDYAGQLAEFSMKSGPEDCWVSFGFAFASAASVNHMSELTAALLFSVLASEYSCDFLLYNTGFLVLHGEPGNAEPVVIRQLTLTLDPDVPQTLLEALDPSSEAYQLLHDFNQPEPEPEPEDYLFDFDQEKLQSPNVLRSDIIAGIDHGSIVVEGATTFFSSTLSDGAVVRFEAEHIDISQDGITIYPDSVITSLDALGKIFGYYPTVENRESYADTSLGIAELNWGYGYTYSASRTSVAQAEEVHTWSLYGISVKNLNGSLFLTTTAHDPNFVYLEGDLRNNTRSFVLSSLVVCYDPTEKVTAITDATLYSDFSASYLEGEFYDSSLEGSADLASKAMSFYLILKPDTELADMADSSKSIYFVPNSFYSVGPLRDAAGNQLDKSNAVLEPGSTLEIIVGDYTIQMDLSVLERYDGAQTMHDLVPYAYPQALGDLNTLVVPVIWADQTDMANSDTLKLFREAVGRIVDEAGTVTDYSVTTDEMFSLSEYYDIASYGKMKVTSFMTDWYYSGSSFADVWQTAPDSDYANEIMDWVRATYPDMDWSRYDQDGNGYVDSMVILNAGIQEGDELYIISYSGAICYGQTYYGDYAGTQDAPRVNTYSTINYSLIQGDYSTLIHEFAHGFGLIDYYDVYYSGIDAVGGFDMQSQSVGDWNAYSKYAVGWMDPRIVQGLASGESVEYTIGSSALTDDVIIIPAAGAEFDGPFGEYVMIDLLSDDGVNEFDAARYGLGNTAGVRISHVNANMEKRTMEIESVVNPGESAEYTIGTIHIANEYKASDSDRYNIEVIQSGGRNTFTCANDPAKLFPVLTAADLFYAGDTFRVEDYSEFFYNGLMDDGSAFGYTVQILRVGTDENGNPTATIRITAQ